MTHFLIYAVGLNREALLMLPTMFRYLIVLHCTSLDPPNSIPFPVLPSNLISTRRYEWNRRRWWQRDASQRCEWRLQRHYVQWPTTTAGPHPVVEEPPPLPPHQDTTDKSFRHLKTMVDLIDVMFASDTNEEGENDGEKSDLSVCFNSIIEVESVVCVREKLNVQR